MINSREEKKICVLQLWMYKKYMECFEHASWNKVSNVLQSHFYCTSTLVTTKFNFVSYTDFYIDNDRWSYQ